MKVKGQLSRASNSQLVSAAVPKEQAQTKQLSLQCIYTENISQDFQKSQNKFLILNKYFLTFTN